MLTRSQRLNSRSGFPSAFTTYEIELKIGGFNDKWMFLIGTPAPPSRTDLPSDRSLMPIWVCAPVAGTFTSAPSAKSSRKSRGTPTNAPASAFAVPDVALGSGTDTPTSGSSTPNGMAAAIASALKPRADGRVVHCISVTSFVSADPTFCFH